MTSRKLIKILDGAPRWFKNFVFSPLEQQDWRVQQNTSCCAILQNSGTRMPRHVAITFQERENNQRKQSGWLARPKLIRWTCSAINDRSPRHISMEEEKFALNLRLLINCTCYSCFSLSFSPPPPLNSPRYKSWLEYNKKGVSSWSIESKFHTKNRETCWQIMFRLIRF